MEKRVSFSFFGFPENIEDEGSMKKIYQNMFQDFSELFLLIFVYYCNF